MVPVKYFFALEVLQLWGKKAASVRAFLKRCFTLVVAREG